MNKKKLLTSLLLTAIIAILNVHWAFGQEWEQVDLPEGVVARTIHFHNSDIYLGTESGVYYSNDNCENWELLGLGNHTIFSIILTDQNELFVGASSYVYKYMGNQQWQLLISNPGSGTVACLFQSSDGYLYEGTWGGIYRSIDEGETWEQVLETKLTEVINDIEENAEGVLFAGSTAYMYVPGGFYRSEDKGDTWNLVGLNYHFISSIEINSYDTIFVGTRGHYYTGIGHIFKGLDYVGNSWQMIYENNLVVSMSINDDDVIAIGCAMYGMREPGGIYKSYDNGISWIDISDNISTRYIDEVVFGPQNYLYAITFNSYELFRTIDPITSIVENRGVNSNMIKVFPNPAHDQITLDLKDLSEDCTGELLDLEGSKLKEIVICKTEESKKIQINNFEKGIYFIVLKSDNHRYISKFIKY